MRGRRGRLRPLRGMSRVEDTRRRRWASAGRLGPKGSTQLRCGRTVDRKWPPFPRLNSRRPEDPREGCSPGALTLGASSRGAKIRGKGRLRWLQIRVRSREDHAGWRLLQGQEGEAPRATGPPEASAAVCSTRLD
jgi:hypothetical protein